jgi:tetratricopeptide (TPR) repeat protein
LGFPAQVGLPLPVRKGLKIGAEEGKQTVEEPNVHELLQEGIAAAKAAQKYEAEPGAAQDRPGSAAAGQNELKQKARRLLLQVTELDETNIQAWLWLSAVMDDLIDKYTCLENVVALDPDNQAAKAGLKLIGQQITPSYARRDVVESAPSSPEQLQPAGQESHLGWTTQLWVGDPYHPHLKESWYQRPEQESVAPAALEPAAAKPAKAACPFCHKPVRNMDMICPHCKLSLVMDCPRCNTLMDVEQQSCSQCGYEMGDYKLGSVYFTQLATGYQRYSRLPKALAALQFAEQMNPDQPDLYRHMGEVQAELGKTGAAIATLQRALEQEPDQVGPYLALGKVFQQEGNWEKAEQIYRQAQKVLPRSSGPHSALGDLFLQRGQPARARAHLQQATRLNPNDGLAFARLGQLYEASGKRKRAIRVYYKALQRLSPGLPEWKLVRERLQTLDPNMSARLAQGWSVLIQQLAGPILVTILAIFLDSGLRSWWVDGSVWLMLGLATFGAFLAISGASLPKNPVIRLLVGRKGLEGAPARIFVAMLGVFFWLLALGIILWPPPELPFWQ